MIVGGALRGLTRARRISTQVALGYLAIGIPLTVLLEFLSSPSQEDFLWMLVPTLTVGPALCLPPLFLMTLIANLAFVRLFPRRTWRNERWRALLAGALGLIFTFGGMLLVTALMHGPPEMFRDVFGSSAAPVYLGGWFVLLSNLGLLVAWLIPSRRS